MTGHSRLLGAYLHGDALANELLPVHWALSTRTALGGQARNTV